MTDGGSLSPADVMAMSNDGMGGNNAFFWIFALLLLGGLGNGGGLYGGGYRPQYATQDFVQNGFNFNDLQDQNRDPMNAVTGGRVLEKLKDKAKKTADKLTDGAVEVIEDIANHIVK